MRQYTTPNQTAKLIEMGFKQPKGWYVDGVTNNIKLYVNIDKNPMMFNYSIGELLSFLPKEIDSNGLKNTLYIFVNQDGWCVEYSDFLGELYSTYRSEFIDAIFDMCVKLKEEGVI